MHVPVFSTTTFITTFATTPTNTTTRTTTTTNKPPPTTRTTASRVALVFWHSFTQSCKVHSEGCSVLLLLESFTRGAQHPPSLLPVCSLLRNRPSAGFALRLLPSSHDGSPDLWLHASTVVHRLYMRYHHNTSDNSHHYNLSRNHHNNNIASRFPLPFFFLLPHSPYASPYLLSPNA